MYERIEIVSENKPKKVRFILGLKFNNSIKFSILVGKKVMLKHKEIEKINRKKKKVVKFIGYP
jgi:hypothetical protein